MYETTLEQQVISDLEPLLRRSVNTLGAEYGSPNPVTSRTVWSLSKRMLNSLTSYSELIQSEDLQLRSVILSSTRRPTQSMSFASFDYGLILNERWEESEFYRQISSRFLFMRYLTLNDGTIVFDGAKFWSMPDTDIAEAKNVWAKTVSQIATGQAHALPTIAESPVAHVRPRATNAADTILAPDGRPLTRKCFWLNASYIANHIQ
jgi:DNA mismatch repair protein MutH